MTQSHTAWVGLLQPLLTVRHAHLRPLEALARGQESVSLHYGEPGPCAYGCDGIVGALRAVHRAGLWVGDLLAAIGLDSSGRVILTGVGSTWDLADPFAGHPAAGGVRDLRVGWRQRSDLAQLPRLSRDLLRCG